MTEKKDKKAPTSIKDLMASNDKKAPTSIKDLMASDDKKDQVIGAYRMFVNLVPDDKRKSHQSRGSYLRGRKNDITNELILAMEALKDVPVNKRNSEAKAWLELVNTTVFSGGKGGKLDVKTLQEKFFQK